MTSRNGPLKDVGLELEEIAEFCSMTHIYVGDNQKARGNSTSRYAPPLIANFATTEGVSILC